MIKVTLAKKHENFITSPGHPTNYLIKNIKCNFSYLINGITKFYLLEHDNETPEKCSLGLLELDGRLEYKYDTITSLIDKIIKNNDKECLILINRDESGEDVRKYLEKKKNVELRNLIN